MPKLKFKDSSGEWIEIVGIKGDKGEQGPAGPAGKDGAPGADGVDGYTPIKGIDYFTEAEKQEIVELVIASLANGDEVSY